jgi:hypothetical protein
MQTIDYQYVNMLVVLYICTVYVISNKSIGCQRVHFFSCAGVVRIQGKTIDFGTAFLKEQIVLIIILFNILKLVAKLKIFRIYLAVSWVLNQMITRSIVK